MNTRNRTTIILAVAGVAMGCFAFAGSAQAAMVVNDFSNFSESGTLLGGSNDREQ